MFTIIKTNLHLQIGALVILWYDITRNSINRNPFDFHKYLEGENIYHNINCYKPYRNDSFKNTYLLYENARIYRRTNKNYGPFGGIVLRPFPSESSVSSALVASASTYADQSNNPNLGLVYSGCIHNTVINSIVRTAFKEWG